MSDELRAAAERCRGLEGPGWVDTENASAECVADLLVLARAWMAEHPADDAEPVTADWLEATGWERHDARPGWRRWKRVVCVQRHDPLSGATTHWLDIHEPQTGADGSVWWPINFWQQHESDEKPEGVAWLSWVDHTTRGHVRRLLAALGLVPSPP
jgi:hypothetical protein